MYKVVIADDEPIMRKAMHTLIDWEGIGCQLVCVASSGTEVMTYLKEKTPDILILDIRMPGMNGIDLAQYVYEEKLPVKIILLTAYADFSYAQLAVKCNVVDYVIKTGTFEELIVAIEKAKTAISVERLKCGDEHQDILKENFFKGIFDGSLSWEKDMLEKAERIGIATKKTWLVIAIRFCLKKDSQRESIYQSLLRFLGMVFEQYMVHGIPVKEDEMVVVLADDNESFEKTIQEQCIQIVNMMDKFMKMNVYIGISSPAGMLSGLKQIFDEAEQAVEEGFFYEKKRINSYKELQKRQKESLEPIDGYLSELYHVMKKGMQVEVLQHFHEILTCMGEKGYTTTTIFDIGIEIIAVCKKLLSEYDKSIYDIIPYERSISQKVYQCKHISEYTELLTTILEHVAEYIQMAVSKKNIVIYEAEKYIEENYQKSITVSEVARSVGVSLSYLSRIYKESTGNTLINYINQKKMEKAKYCLSDTDMKIYEIAELLGFENTTYFSYFFKKNMGIPPKEYKLSCKE